MNYIIKRYSILSLLLLLCGVVGQAQTLVFEQSFKEFDTESDLGETDPRFPGWTFSNCNARSSGFLRVGYRGDAEQGSVTTASIPLSGNALIALRVKISKAAIDGETNFTVSTTSGTLRQTSYTIIRGDNNPFGLPIYLDNGGSDTQITINVDEDTDLFIQSIRVYDIGDAIFYESFDAMKGNENTPFAPSGTDASEKSCDNTEGSYFNDIKQSFMNVIVNSTNSLYRMPSISVMAGTNYLLSFSMARTYKGDISNITLNSSDAAKFSSVNTGDVSTIAESQNYILSEDDYRIWQDYYTVITDMTSSTVLTFGGYSINLDNILLTPIPTLLDEAANNITYIKGHAGQTTDVELRRTLTANVWCPLCLPFDVTPESFATAVNAVAADANPVLRTFSSVSEGVFTFDVVPAAKTIAAGTPFLVKVTKQVANPTFANVTVVNTPAKAVPANRNYQFVGTYSPVNLNTDGTHLFLGTDGTLYKPGTAAGYNRMNGLRAYFQIPAAASGTRISLPGDETTAIQDINDDGYQYEHRFDSEAVRTQNLLPRQITIREGRKYLSK